MNATFPRVDLPAEVAPTPEQQEQLTELLEEYALHQRHIHKEKVGVVGAMFRTGRPIARRGKPTRKRKRTTKHVRHMAKVADRSTKR